MCPGRFTRCQLKYFPFACQVIFHPLSRQTLIKGFYKLPQGDSTLLSYIYCFLCNTTFFHHSQFGLVWSNKLTARCWCQWPASPTDRSEGRHDAWRTAGRDRAALYDHHHFCVWHLTYARPHCLTSISWGTRGVTSPYCQCKVKIADGDVVILHFLILVWKSLVC